MNLPVSIDDYEAYARKILPPMALDYYQSGADAEITLRRNRDAYERLLIRPRILVNVEKVTTSTTLLGQPIPFPICVAPTAFHGLAHDEGEKATARACAALKTCYCASTYSNFSMDEVFRSARDVMEHPLQWFQLYVETDREATARLVRHCEALGFQALVVTVDRPRLGRRLADLRNVFRLPGHLRLGNFSSDDPTRQGAEAYVGGQIDPALTWEDIGWLKTVTRLPIVIKGIFRGEDAKKAIEHGVDAILVSNHGGRQLDGCPATLEVLPEIVDVCRDTKVEVYVDGGIRKGSDIFKALAIGARAVFIGRPILWGLAYKGQTGVQQVLSLLHFDFRLTMALAGCTSVDQIGRDYIVPAEELSFARTLTKSRI
ncbi:Hydroxyacid oxidase 2 [Apophysomyces ossiformis]|uniref:Oxidase FUB9 n=1 Tax=Apophysomyces ossiformis TaxID=679940 RepID=A0A8H7EVH5_9FUNG|nr:Hydroxyacid oxidase 2 [Apophysomyces ossiformis]